MCVSSRSRAHVLVLDVAPVLAQVHGDAVGAAEVRLDRGPDRVRLVGAPRLPHGGDVVDVDAELDHRSCSSESTVRVCSAWPLQALADQRAHQAPRLVARPRRVVVVRRHVEQCPAADDRVAVGAPLVSHRAALGFVGVVLAGSDRSAPARGVALEHRSIPELGQHALLETAQDRGDAARAPAQARQRLAVDVEQGLVRIVARQQAQQQLVEVEAAHQAEAGERPAARPPTRPPSACPAPPSRSRSGAADGTRAARRASPSAAGARRARAAPTRPKRRVNASTIRLVSLYG